MSHLYDNMSRDYDTLFHLVKVSRIICLVDFDKPMDGYQIRDVCQSHIRKNSNYIDISCRGYSYIWAEDKCDFIEQCRKKNLEFFIPTKSPYGN